MAGGGRSFIEPLRSPQPAEGHESLADKLRTAFEPRKR